MASTSKEIPGGGGGGESGGCGVQLHGRTAAGVGAGGGAGGGGVRGMTSMPVIAPQGEVKFDDKIKVSAEAKDFITRCLKVRVHERMDITEAVKHTYIRK